jgi:hypothetical protein
MIDKEIKRRNIEWQKSSGNEAMWEKKLRILMGILAKFSHIFGNREIK